jgi:hypothetical protein
MASGSWIGPGSGIESLCQDTFDWTRASKDEEQNQGPGKEALKQLEIGQCLIVTNQ